MFGSIFSALVNSACGVHDFSLTFAPQIFYSCLRRILILGFLFLTGLGHIDGAGFSFFAGFMGEYLDQPACSIGEHSGSQSSCLRARKIRAVAGTYQGLIGYDSPVMSRVLPDHSEYSTSEGHRKEDVTNKVLDPPFTNLTQRSDSDEKLMLIR